MTAWRRLIIVATLLAMSPGVLRAESGQQPESSPIPSSVWDSAPEPEDKKPASDESTADTARAEVSDPCLEGPVLEVSLKGCDVPGCKDPAFVAGLLDLADLTTGVVADAGRRSTGLERLGRLGFFRSASIVCEPAVGGVFATLVVVVERRLRSLVFKGNSHFDDSAIANRLALQRGDRIDALDSGTTELLERSRDAIRRAYQEEGFIGTVVTTRLQDVGNTLTDMMVDIKEGSRVRIRDVHVGLGPSRPDDPGASSTAEGCPVVLERDLKNWAGLESASTLTEKTIPNVISRLTRALRVVGFSGVRVEAAFDASSQGLRIEAKYDSCYLLRFYSRDRELPGRVGFTPLKDEDLLKSLPFADSGVFDLAESVLGREEVRGWFENRGFLFAGVVLDYRQRRGTSDSVAQDEIVHAGGGAWGRHVAGRVSYFITRGGKVEIRDIRLSGVKSLPIEKVRGVMATKEYDFLGGPGAVLPDQVFSDMEQIRRMYAENGFRNMRFLGTVDSGQRVRQKTEEGTSTVYTYATDSQAFQVVVLPGNTEGVLLRIGIDEGTRTLVGKVAIDGVVSKRLDEAIKVLDLGSSGPFSPSRVRAAVQRLARWYAASGHLRTSIVVLCGGDDPEAPCDLDNVTAEKVELTVRVNEGTPATIGSVFVQGLGRTKPVTVTSRLPKPGDPYDVVRVADGVRYLNDLGIFTSVQVSAVGADENPPRNQVALVVECRETKTRFIDFALGFETMNDARANVMPESAISGISTSIGLSDLVTSGSGRSVDLPLPDILLTIEARYVDLNFLGLGKRMYLPIKYGLSFTAWDRYASFAPTYHDPNFFVRGLSFRATPYAVYDRATKAIDQIQFGATKTNWRSPAATGRPSLSSCTVTL
jgi:outer membrane protein assembly factor BamA